MRYVKKSEEDELKFKAKLYRLFDLHYKPDDIAEILNIPKCIVEEYYKEYKKEKKLVEKSRW